MKTQVLLLFAFLAFACCQSVDFENGSVHVCSGPDAHLHIDQLSIVPDPPRVGKNVTVTFRGHLDKVITAGEAKFKVAFFGITLIEDKENICKLDPKEYPCPLHQGPYTRTITLPIPEITPHGDYSGKVTAHDQDNEEILCLAFDVHLA